MEASRKVKALDTTALLKDHPAQTGRREACQIELYDAGGGWIQGRRSGGGGVRPQAGNPADAGTLLYPIWGSGGDGRCQAGQLTPYLTPCRRGSGGKGWWQEHLVVASDFTKLL